MRDFIDDLDDRLRAAATSTQEGEAPSAARRRLRRPAFLGAAAASLGTLGAVFVFGGTSLADLPIFTTPTTDATGTIARGAREAREAKVDFSKAHAFLTPAGPGYVLVTPDRTRVCVAAPDASMPGAYLSACGAPLERVEREGLVIEVVGDLGTDPEATSLFAFVLPEDATDVRLQPVGGRAAPADVEAGVVAEEITAPVDVRWRQDGTERVRRFEGPFPATSSVMVTCSDGRTVELGTTPPTQRALTEARRRACRR